MLRIAVARWSKKTLNYKSEIVNGRARKNIKVLCRAWRTSTITNRRIHENVNQSFDADRASRSQILLSTMTLNYRVIINVLELREVIVLGTQNYAITLS